MREDKLPGRSEADLYLEKIHDKIKDLGQKESAMVRALIAYRLALNDARESSSPLKGISHYGGTSPNSLKYGGRQSNTSALRAVAAHWYRCSNESFPSIARILGGRNHTSIIHSCRIVNEYICRFKPLVDAAITVEEAKERKSLDEIVNGEVSTNSSDILFEQIMSVVSKQLEEDHHYVRALVAREIVLRNGGFTSRSLVSRLAKLYGTTIGKIKHGRSPRLSAIRRVGMHMYRDRFGFSYTEVAEEFGRRGPSAVGSACKKIDDLLERYSLLITKAFDD